MNSSLKNHELPREMKHHPAQLAEALVFGVLGNEDLTGCEWIDPTLSKLARGGWITNLPRWPRAQEVTKTPDLQFKIREVLGKPRQVGHLTPECDLERCWTGGRFLLALKCQDCHSRCVVGTSSHFLGS